ncbi:MAG: tyrosine-type recombinase/integrase [Ruminobacter sp.]|uniref:tyrosine-type recombinase/integrase n=1 Tax=Ruminobacter sp. TaxID=2774296 RepID=UPI001B59E1EB|nr:tyrosine-type recombinase/integrase [Ruminobacter sp.]MBP3747990.1 tyrosine-type recombinase/integrase [Ruminobacter sp.]
MSKIKQSDLRVKLGLGESKRVSEVNGLTLIITGTQKGTSFKFQHRCTLNGKRIEKILKTKDLDEARQLAAERMLKVNNGNHPDEVQSHGLIFGAVADEWFKQQKLAPRTARHQHCYLARLKDIFGDSIVSEIREDQVHSAIVSLQNKFGTWSAKQTLSTMSRILRYAKIVYKAKIPDARDLQTLFNGGSHKHRPSLTEGDLDNNILHIFLSIKGSSSKSKDKHIVLTYLAFLMLLRLNEINEIKVSNINFVDKVLFIEKTKTLSDGFKVPITPELERVLRYLVKKSNNQYLLSSSVSESGKMALSYVSWTLTKLNIGQTFHGIRSIGRMWMHQNGIPFEVAESCLTHVVGSAVTRAYLRTDYFEERRQAMEKWHEYLHELLKDIVTFE